MKLQGRSLSEALNMHMATEKQQPFKSARNLPNMNKYTLPEDLSFDFDLELELDLDDFISLE
ncbi:hypothetical protein SS50377_24031 [Spironucleus salmonicida]|uniref:Uncharacterized protein n=1 Tax=Spironucleus salmonicida TaxID=348837 RepID=V6LQV9_9EUKA|nr:hypothetical protein SS50377_24031 [Spironucleus salmonicida]|eukprot:EST47062.1 Hypothetical protein SS50377_12868 [Spironucleus salmonicida]